MKQEAIKYINTIFLLFYKFQSPPFRLLNSSEVQSYIRVNQVIMYNSYMIKCKICKKQIRSQQQCCILCPYCHDYHQNNQLAQGVCPKMQEFISLIRPSDHFPCPECEGEGNFTKITKITYYQSLKKYQSRLSEWEKQNKQNTPKPQRKILKEEVQQITQLICTKCEGTGKINRIIFCKQQTCRKCLVYKTKSKLHVNLHWAAIHRSKVEMEPDRRGEVCAACRRSVQLDNKRVKLPCKHILHGYCYEEILQQGSCSICQTVISWRQVQKIAKEITEMRREQIGKEQNYINDDSFCIRKTKDHRIYDEESNIIPEEMNNLSFNIQNFPPQAPSSDIDRSWLSSAGDDSLRGYTDESAGEEQQYFPQYQPSQ